MPFYVSVWTWVHALERRHVLHMAGCGVLLGLTFLAHSAAGIVLGGIMLVTSCVYTTPLRTPRLALALTRTAAPFFVATVVVAPFLVPIAARYGFHVVNRAPATWVYDAAHPIAVIAGAARPSALVNLVIVGIGVLWAYRRVELVARVLLAAWALVAASCLGYSLLAERWPALPTVVPAYHFLFLLRALKWLLFGCGIIALADALAPVLSRRGGLRVTPTLVRASFVLLLAAAIYPRYLGREAFVAAPALARSVTQDDREAYRWIRSHTDSSAVFLSSDVDALRVVGAAGRAVVSVYPFFSNPYVEYEPRQAAGEEMFAALAAGDRSRFEPLRRRFEVSHILARDEQARVIRDRSADFLQPVFTSGSIVIFSATRLPPPPPLGRGRAEGLSELPVERADVRVADLRGDLLDTEQRLQQQPTRFCHPQLAYVIAIAASRLVTKQVLEMPL